MMLPRDALLGTIARDAMCRGMCSPGAAGRRRRRRGYYCSHRRAHVFLRGKKLQRRAGKSVRTSRQSMRRRRHCNTRCYDSCSGNSRCIDPRASVVGEVPRTLWAFPPRDCKSQFLSAAVAPPYTPAPFNILVQCLHNWRHHVCTLWLAPWTFVKTQFFNRQQFVSQPLLHLYNIQKIPTHWVFVKLKS